MVESEKEMIEAAVVVDRSGARSRALKWHLPPGRNVAALPDDAGLWEFIWENRDQVGGIAHTHPGSGQPSPSYTDITTFSAIELALGRRLQWWIASADRLSLAIWAGPDNYAYNVFDISSTEPEWLAELRNLSR